MIVASSCATCGRAAPEFVTTIDGRRFPVCSRCVSPVVGVPAVQEHDSWADKVARMARRFDTFTIRELVDGLGYDDETIRNNISQAAMDLRRRGVIERIRGSRGDNDTTYRYVRAEARAA